MAASFQTFPFAVTVFIMVCVLAAGIFMTCRGQGICSHDSFREALMWGGGFIIYAAVDYFILMR